jgi:DNA-binding CsgD family transcriptional regulator
LQARIALGHGELVAAEANLAAAQELFADGKHPFGVDVFLWAQAGALEARGEPGQALALLAGVWDQAGAIRGLLQYRSLAPDLVRLALLTGEVNRARAVADDVEQMAASSTALSARAAALRCRGLVESDAALLVDAIVQYRATPRRLDLADTCEEAAIALFNDGRDAEAIALLEETAAIYLDAGADACVTRVDALLRTHGIRRRRHGPSRATHGWDALSPNERRIVELVAEGLSNPQIGARLFISRRTVETHLSHIFTKLDVSSRAQVAALAAARAHGQLPTR